MYCRFHWYIMGLPVKVVSLNNAAGGKPAGMFLLAVIVSVSH